MGNVPRCAPKFLSPFVDVSAGLALLTCLLPLCNQDLLKAFPTSPFDRPESTINNPSSTGYEISFDTDFGSSESPNFMVAESTLGIQANPMPQCQSFFHVLSAHAHLFPQINNFEEGPDVVNWYVPNAAGDYTNIYRNDKGQQQCINRPSAINFSFTTPRGKNLVRFELEAFKEGIDPRSQVSARYTMNHARNSFEGLPLIPANSVVGIESIEMNCVVYAVNQSVKLSNYVAGDDLFRTSANRCSRLRHHSLFINVPNALYVEVVVQETAV